MSTHALPEVIIGLDLGTSGARAVALTAELLSLGEATRSYEVHLTAEGGAEQSPGAVGDIACAVLSELIQRLSGRAAVRAIALSGTASSLARFEGARPVSPAWLWSDVRSGAEAAALRDRFGLEVYRRTGCPLHGSYWPAKLLRLQPELSRTVRLAGIKDYVLFLLTGLWACDETTAAATGLYDSDRCTWDQELLDLLGLESAQLPEVVPSVALLPLRPGMAAQLGLAPNTPVVAGSVDGVLAHLGLGCFGARHGADPVASCMVGTSGAVRIGSAVRSPDPQARTWTYPAGGGLWVTGGAVNNGGNVLDWLGALLGGGEQLRPDRLVELAGSAPPGGPVFLPYLYGERSPLWREDLRGALLGLSPLHGPADVARAVVEGISLGLDHVFRALTEQAGRPSEVRASGGFLGSPAWLQFQADVFGVPLVVTDQEQAVSTGAAMLAWQAVGEAGLDELSARVRCTRTYEPDATSHAYFAERFAQAQELRRRLWGDGGSQ